MNTVTGTCVNLPGISITKDSLILCLECERKKARVRAVEDKISSLRAVEIQASQRETLRDIFRFSQTMTTLKN